jgi:hypothetical protein
VQEAAEKIGEVTKQSTRSHQVGCKDELKEVNELNERDAVSN